MAAYVESEEMVKFLSADLNVVWNLINCLETTRQNLPSIS